MKQRMLIFMKVTKFRVTWYIQNMILNFIFYLDLVNFLENFLATEEMYTDLIRNKLLSLFGFVAWIIV